MNDLNDFMVPLRPDQIIKPGDRIENRFSPGNEYVAKDGGDGRLLVKYRVGKYWYTDHLEPVEFHRKWRKVTESPALRFVLLLVDKSRENSTSKRPGLIRSAIELAVEAHLRFDIDDFAKLRRHYAYCDEAAYRFVIKSENASAIAALEAYMKRTPFWFDDPNVEKKRIYDGAYFRWEGLQVKVTSFKDENNLVACQQDYDPETRTTKTVRIFRISRDDLARFTEMRRSLLKLSQWVFEQAPYGEGRKSAYRHKPSGEIICSTCVDAARKASGTYLDDELVTPTELERACARCGSPLRTESAQEKRIFALVEAEKSAPGDADLARWLFHALPLGAEMAYLERLVAIGERVGILK